MLCVDPSHEMLKEAEARAPAVSTLLADGTSYAQSLEPGSVDRVLINEMIHHFTTEEQPVFFARLFEGMRPGGVCLTVTHPHEGKGRYPFFDAAFKVWRDNQPPAERFVKVMEGAGFAVTTETHEFAVVLPQAVWLQMLRGRFWSTFSHFTDSELSAGVEEVERNFPADAEGNITFKEALVFLTATKKEG